MEIINSRQEYSNKWKRENYKKNKDVILAKNKAYYYKYKCGFSNEEMRKYGVILPYIAKIKLIVDDFDGNKQILIDYIKSIS